MKKNSKDQNISKLEKAIDNGPINYFSDLFIVAMVVAWIIIMVIMTIFSIISTIAYADNSIWTDLANLVAMPLSCGGALWMIKNAVQHNMAGKQGKEVPFDFPKVNADGEDDGFEEEYCATNQTETEEETNNDEEVITETSDETDVVG